MSNIEDLIDSLEIQLCLLKRWKMAVEEMRTLTDMGRTEEAGKFQTYVNAIMELFREEYGIKFNMDGEIEE